MWLNHEIMLRVIVIIDITLGKFLVQPLQSWVESTAAYNQGTSQFGTWTFLKTLRSTLGIPLSSLHLIKGFLISSSSSSFLKWHYELQISYQIKKLQAIKYITTWHYIWFSFFHNQYFWYLLVWQHNNHGLHWTCNIHQKIIDSVSR